jgi:hypothetical protein
MADTYRVVGTENPTVDWTTEVVLDRDEDGKPTKVVGATQPAELSKGDLDRLKDLGINVEKVTAEQARAIAEGNQVGSDVAAGAPRLSTSSSDENDNE